MYRPGSIFETISDDRRRCKHGIFAATVEKSHDARAISSGGSLMLVQIFAALLMVQASAADRRAYATCLKNAAVSAKAANVTVDGFKAYAHKACAQVESDLKSKLAAFNVRNGMGRKAAADDAQLQLDDYLFTAEDNYRYSIEDPN
jgi:hypothetical protein